MKSLQQVIAESLSLIYGWSIERVQDTATQVEADLARARAESQELKVVPRGKRERRL